MKKRMVALVSIVVLLMSMFVFMSYAAGYYCVYSHNRNGKPVNVYSSPKKSSNVIDKVPYGDEILVIDEDSGYLQLWGEGFVLKDQTCSYDPGPYIPSDAVKKTNGTENPIQAYTK